MSTVYYSARTEEWTVRGEERRAGISGQLVLTKQDLPHLRAVDLKAALVAHAKNYRSDESEADVSELHEDHFDADLGGGQVGFELRQGALLVSVLYFGAWPSDGEEENPLHSVSRLVAPSLDHVGASLHSVEIEDGWSGPEVLAVRLRLRIPWRGRTLDYLFAVGEDVLQLCDAFGAAEITRDSVADLVRGGCAGLLVGQAEGHWLDAKSEEYDLTSTRGKISLAQAVARFANAEEGGLIVVGAKAKKIPDGEVIREVRGIVPRHSDTRARYLRVLDHHLYPPALGIRIDLIPAEGKRALIAIDIPPQPEEQKPFLVHGAITAEGETEGAFISIVQRRGEGSIPITAPMIHSTLAAGRALLRGQTTHKGDRPRVEESD
ncbi:ATP-binding protein [Tessaracoccus flavescens]|uniref:ATP-binding protein n=1 Tax=Tessaracoccus flavescens TaxID=399497 RepID=UPI0012602D05|nr:ATP-binding protein [Tessaracoccus flavescens]